MHAKKRVIKVDVIIAVHNAESTIEETIRSAMSQEIPDHLTNRLSGCRSTRQNRPSDEGAEPSKGDAAATLDGDEASYHGYDTHVDVCICCYNDASTDRSLAVLESLAKECTRKYFSTEHTSGGNSRGITMHTEILIGTAPIGAASRGAGYARNQAVKLRDEYEARAMNETKQGGGECAHFLCILDSDDIMHPARVSEQVCAMLSLDSEKRQKTLMGCQFDRIPKDSTQHYSQWANSLSDERLYLEQFRECTLIQPTWFLSKAWFHELGGYLEPPTSNVDEKNHSKRMKIDSDRNGPHTYENDEIKPDTSVSRKQFYRLFHPSEINLVINNGVEAHGKRKMNSQQNTTVNTLRLAEDSRLFYAHLYSGGRLHLHRTSSPLVSYRHRSGMSQSSNTPRKLLLKLRAKAWEDIVFHENENSADSCKSSAKWTDGFAIWGAGRDGKDFLKALSPGVASKAVCFVDVDMKKIEKVKWYDNPSIGRRIPILHFSVLAENTISGPATFGRINKKNCGEGDFCFVSRGASNQADEIDHQNEDPSESKMTDVKKKKGGNSIDSMILRKLPVVVCVAMYRTNGALESNVASIGRNEGKGLWHII